MAHSASTTEPDFKLKCSKLKLCQRFEVVQNQKLCKNALQHTNAQYLNTFQAAHSAYSTTISWLNLPTNLRKPLIPSTWPTPNEYYMLLISLLEYPLTYLPSTWPTPSWAGRGGRYPARRWEHPWRWWEAAREGGREGGRWMGRSVGRSVGR